MPINHLFLLLPGLYTCCGKFYTACRIWQVVLLGKLNLADNRTMQSKILLKIKKRKQAFRRRQYIPLNAYKETASHALKSNLPKKR